MRSLSFACILGALVFAGCGDDGPPTLPPAPTPLSVAEWKTLEIPIKYDEGTFDRLKMNDPKLQTDRGWDRFMREVIVPERKKDIPGVPGQ